MDTITIIVIIVLIIFVIVGIYLYQEMSDKIEILTEETTKAKEEKTTFLDETSELKKTIRRIANDVNARLERAEEDVDEVKKEAFTLSMHGNQADTYGGRGPHPAVAAYGPHALPPRENRPNPMGNKPPGMSDEMFEKLNAAQKEGMKQNNCEVREEFFDPSKKMTPKQIEYDRMDPGSAAAERRAEGFAGHQPDNSWRPVMANMVQQASQQQAAARQSFTPDEPVDNGAGYQDEFIPQGGFDFETGDIGVDFNDEFM